MLIALLAYSRYGLGWKTFAIYFFAPDLAFFGYLAGPRVGACAYNTTHSYIGATIVLMSGILLNMPVELAAGIIWCAHIGFDRALGYGLKYASGFGHTHLGLVGRAKSEPG